MFCKVTLVISLACLWFVFIGGSFGCGYIKDFKHARKMLLTDGLGSKTRAFFQQQFCDRESSITK